MNAPAAFWDRIAEEYAAKPVADPAAFERKIAWMKARMGPSAAVLDVGCGTGSLATLLAPFAAEVHGLDFSPEMLRIARAKAAAQGLTNVHFHLGAIDAEELPFAEGRFDLVSACSLLHLVPDRDATLARLYRLVKPGGVFVTSTVCLAESWVPFVPILTVLRWFGKAPPVASLTRATLADDVRRAGFVEVEAPDVGAEAKVGFFVARRPSAA